MDAVIEEVPEVYNQTKLIAIEKTLRDAMDKVQKDGLTIVSGAWNVSPVKVNATSFSPYPLNIDPKINWISARRECCPNGAVLLTQQPEVIYVVDKELGFCPRPDHIAVVAKALDVSQEFVEEFIHGFDGSSCFNKEHAKGQQGYDMGKAFRKEIFSAQFDEMIEQEAKATITEQALTEE